MRQLSAHDASFLYSDSTHANANVTLIHIYDQSTAPGGLVRFKSILRRIEERIAQLPKLRQKLARVPLDLDHPYWVDDPNFDLEYHVRHIALPKPGDWRQFCIQASRIHARPLDLGRPLWEIHVIEGLDGFLDLPPGTFALLTKTHHAMIDPENGSEITMLLHDTTPEPPPPAPPVPWFPERAPGLLPRVARGLANSALAPLTLAGPLGRVWRYAAPAAAHLMTDLMRPAAKMPVTRFNAIVSPHRVFETRRFQLDEFKAIRTLVEGADVNDVVLAVCAGALRRYLAQHDELPTASLSAMAPFYVRDPEAPADAPAQLAFTRVDLGTDLDDPVARLAHVHAQTSSSAVVARALGARELVQAGQRVPAATLALSGKLLGRALGTLGQRTPLAHCTVTNVPGPERPLYLCGARMTYFSAIMPIADGNGLVFAVTSYDGKVVVSPTSCRELMPDPALFAQCVRDSFQELLARAVPPALPGPKPVRKPAREPATKPATKSAATKSAVKSAVKSARAPTPRKAPAAAPRSARRRASPSGRRSPTSPVG